MVCLLHRSYHCFLLDTLSVILDSCRCVFYHFYILLSSCLRYLGHHLPNNCPFLSSLPILRVRYPTYPKCKFCTYRTLSPLGLGKHGRSIHRSLQCNCKWGVACTWNRMSHRYVTFTSAYLLHSFERSHAAIVFIDPTCLFKSSGDTAPFLYPLCCLSHSCSYGLINAPILSQILMYGHISESCCAANYALIILYDNS